MGGNKTCLPGEAAQTWQAFVTFPSLDSFFCHSWLCCSFAESCKIKEPGVASTVFFPLKMAWRFRRCVLFFTIYCTLRHNLREEHESDGDHNSNLEGSLNRSVLMFLTYLVFTSGCGLQVSRMDAAIVYLDHKMAQRTLAVDLLTESQLNSFALRTIFLTGPLRLQETSLRMLFY